MTISSDRLAFYLTHPISSPAQAAALILQATGDPQLHEFSELLHHPSYSSLCNTEHHSSHQLLRLFTYGTITDYMQSPSSFPPLSDMHLLKLRALTLVTLANGSNQLDYSTLQSHLHLSTTRLVEAVVLHAVYAGLIRAKMDQRANKLEIISAVGRDVPIPNGVTDMVRGLRLWASRSNMLIDEIDDKLKYIRAHTETRRKLL